MNTRVHMVVLCKGVKKCMTFMFFRAQFGQSRSFNSLSHKNLIMNMEPLVPALPSTNEYEETAVDSGRRILLTTDPNTHNRHALMHKTQRERALIEQLMLPSRHQSCLPGDQLRHTKNTLS